MKYGEEYNINDIVLAIARAVEFFEIFRDQTEEGRYDRIQTTSPDAWYNAFVNAYPPPYRWITGGIYDLAKQVANGSRQWSSLTKDQKTAIITFIHRFSGVQSTYTASNVNRIYGITDPANNWDNPYWRSLATESPYFATFEPQAYYTLGITGYLKFTFFDPNAGTLIGQPSYWGTKYFVAQQGSENEVLLFYSHFKYHDKQTREAISNRYTSRDYALAVDWNIYTIHEDVKLLEYQNLNINIGQAASYVDTEAYYAINSNYKEKRIEFAIDQILYNSGVIQSGFDWYLDEKPTWNGKLESIGSASIIIYRDFDQDRFVSGSSVCVKLKNSGQYKNKLKVYDIYDLSLKLSPRGVSNFSVPHYPTSFMGIGAFVNYFPDTFNYDSAAVSNDNEVDNEYRASFPLNPTVELFQRESGYDNATENKLDSNFVFYEDGYTNEGSVSKNEYINTIFNGNPNNGNFTNLTLNNIVSLDYPPNSSSNYGKVSETGIFWTAQDNYNFYINKNYISGVTIKNAESSGILYHKFGDKNDFLNPPITYPNLTRPINFAPKFGKRPVLSEVTIGGEPAAISYNNIQPLNCQKRVVDYTKFNSGDLNSSLYSLTRSQSASRYTHCEFFKRRYLEERSPSSCMDIYHIFKTNIATGTISITGYYDSAEISTGTTPWQNTLNTGIQTSIITNSYVDSPIISSTGNSDSVKYSDNFFNLYQTCYFGVNRAINDENGIYSYEGGKFIPSNKDLNKIWKVLSNGSEQDFGSNYLYFKSLNKVIPRKIDNYPNEDLNIYWQAQVLETTSHPIYRIDNQKPYYSPPSVDLIHHLDSSTNYDQYSLGLLGGIEFRNEITNHLNGSNLFYGFESTYTGVFQSTSVNTSRNPSVRPVLRWGIESEKYKKYTGLYDWFTGMPIASTGETYIGDEWNYSDSIIIINDTTNTGTSIQDVIDNKLYHYKLYGTPATIKHKNRGKAFSHPDICYSYEDSVRFDTEGENPSSFINYRMEFSGAKRAKKDGLGRYMGDDILANNLIPEDLTEYEQLFYNFSENNSFLIGYKGKYKNFRPTIANQLVQGLGAKEALYNYCPAGFGIADIAVPINQDPYPTTAQYYGNNRLPPESLGSGDFIKMPYYKFNDRFEWHKEYYGSNGYASDAAERIRRDLT